MLFIPIHGTAHSVRYPNQVCRESTALSLGQTWTEPRTSTMLNTSQSISQQFHLYSSHYRHHVSASVNLTHVVSLTSKCQNENPSAISSSYFTVHTHTYIDIFVQMYKTCNSLILMQLPNKYMYYSNTASYASCAHYSASWDVVCNQSFYPSLSKLSLENQHKIK